MTKSYSALDLQRMPVLGLVPESSATASPPSSPVEGQLWVDTTTHNLKVYLNGSWIQADNQGVATGAGVSDGDKGDITVTSSGTVWTIDTGVVTSAKIADGTIAMGDLAFTPITIATNAGGDLQGTYPNPDLAPGVVDLTTVNTGLIENGVGTGTAATTAVALRRLGTGANDAMAGNTTLNAITAPTAAVSLNSQKVTNLADPTLPADAATKSYVDTMKEGLDPKASVKAATTANITLSGTPQTIDGISCTAADRVLVKNQTNPQENGIYLPQAGTWVRTVDLDAWTEVPGAFTWVEQGTVNADTGWVSTADQGGTLNTTAMPWVQFSGAGSITAGNGLTKTGNTIDAVGTSGRISVGVDNIDIDANYAGQNTITTLGTITTGIWNGVAVPVSNGGTGAATAATARSNLGVPGKVTVASPALTANTWSSNINHGLASSIVHVMVTEAASGENVIIDWKVIDANNVQLRAGLAVSASALNVLVHA